MSEQLVPWAAWAALVVLFVLCLPVGCCQKLVLSLVTWLLRLLLLAVLAGGAYLYFRPTEMPAAVSNLLDDFPALVALLPERGAPHFGLCLATAIVAALLPLLLVFDVTRSLARRQRSEIRNLSDERPAAALARDREPMRGPASSLVPDPEPPPVALPVLRPIDRRTASSTLAGAPRSHIPVAPRSL
jgi:hypothetical protein